MNLLEGHVARRAIFVGTSRCDGPALATAGGTNNRRVSTPPVAPLDAARTAQKSEQQRRLVFQASAVPTGFSGSRRAWIRGIFFLFLAVCMPAVFCASPDPSPSPPNDSCLNCQAIGIGSFIGSTMTATADGASSCPGSSPSADVWYCLVPAIDGMVALNTCVANFDTVISVHSACPGTLANQIGCNDDCPETPCLAPNSCLTFPVTAGLTYYIRVGGFGGSAGDFTLGIRQIDPLMLTIAYDGSRIMVSWNGMGYLLQEAAEAIGPWSDVADAPASPYAIRAREAAKFYRLRRK